MTTMNGEGKFEQHKQPEESTGTNAARMNTLNEKFDYLVSLGIFGIPSVYKQETCITSKEVHELVSQAESKVKEFSTDLEKERKSFVEQ